MDYSLVLILLNLCPQNSELSWGFLFVLFLLCLPFLPSLSHPLWNLPPLPMHQILVFSKFLPSPPPLPRMSSWPALPPLWLYLQQTLRLDRSVFKYFSLILVWLRACYLTSVSFAFFICKTGMMTATNFVELLGELDLGNVCKTLICRMGITIVPTSLGHGES